jgi:hypothetical protein
VPRPAFDEQSRTLDVVRSVRTDVLLGQLLIIVCIEAAVIDLLVLIGHRLDNSTIRWPYRSNADKAGFPSKPRN